MSLKYDSEVLLDRRAGISSSRANEIEEVTATADKVRVLTPLDIIYGRYVVRRGEPLRFCDAQWTSTDI